MAYELYYRAHFTNEQSQSCEIYIYKKDATPPSEVEDYELYACEITDNSEGQTKYDCIIARELFISLATTDALSITWETFIDAEHDTWKIEVFVDGQYYFQGFITPDEGNGPFQDKPYDVNFRATNGLALLKDVPLVDIAGDEFDGDHTLIEYIAGALLQTGLNLNIRIYCGYFLSGMLHKGDSLFQDMFQQAKLNYRTFQSSPTTFVSCYDALKTILDKFCTLEYWNGMWMIACIAEKQYVPVKRYYVDYSSAGAVIGGDMDTINYGQIGKSVDIYPINETQTIYSRYAVKQVKTKYNYTPWPEIPRNVTFERGSLRSETDNGDGTVTRIYDIDDWTFGQWLGQPAQLNALPSLTTPSGGTADAYRQSVFNISGVEISREIYVGGDNSGSNQHKVLQCAVIPVGVDDKLNISFDFKKTFSATGTFQFAAVYIKPTDGTWPGNRYTLENNNSTLQDGGPLFWQDSSGGFNILSRFYDSSLGEDVGTWHSISLDIPAIPVEGDLYFWFYAENPGSTNFSVYRNFNVTYTPFVAGGYIPVKGDYWRRSQSANYPDVIDEEVFISDSPKKAIKGALMFGNALTDPAWYRYGDHTIGDTNPLVETRHFKELLNIGRFNHSRRRMYALEGDFNGLNWAPQNDQLNKQPIGFFWMFREVDMSSIRDFVLVPPLKMDLLRGWINANLVEVKTNSADGTTEGTAEFKYIF